MLPNDLYGPEMGIHYVEDDQVQEFVAQATQRYPDLHPDFLTQICFELPSRFDDYFPGFDPKVNKVIVRRITAQWLKENVRYDKNESMESEYFFGIHVEQYDHVASRGFPMVKEMIAARTWPFRPVIVDYNLGVRELNSRYDLGRPFHLIEGCHRTSYLLKMLALGNITPDSIHEILEVI